MSDIKIRVEKMGDIECEVPDEDRALFMRITLELCVFFDDTEKVNLWLNTENPLLGNMKPSDMIRQGRSEKLLKFIQTSLDENKRS